MRICKFCADVHSLGMCRHRAEAGFENLNHLILLCILVFALLSENSGMVPAKKSCSLVRRSYKAYSRKSRKGYNYENIFPRP